jgi:tetratricopeptide (TPR) repeat protein
MRHYFLVIAWLMSAFVPVRAEVPATAELSRAIRFYDSADFAQAVRLLRAYVGMQPQDHLAHYYLAESLVAMKQNAEALPHYRAAMRPTAKFLADMQALKAARADRGGKLPRVDVAAAKRSVAKAIETVEALPSVLVDERGAVVSVEWSEAAEVLLQLGDVAGARRTLERLEARTRDPDSYKAPTPLPEPYRASLKASTLARIARVYAMIGDADRATRLFADACDASRQSAHPDGLMIARAQVDAGDIPGALAAVRGACARRGIVDRYGEAATLEYIARRYTRVGNFIAAEATIGKIPEGVDDYLRSAAMMDLTQQQLQFGEIEAAWATASSIANDHERALALSNIASARLARGDQPGARRAMAAALAAARMAKDVASESGRRALHRSFPELDGGDVDAALTRLQARSRTAREITATRQAAIASARQGDITGALKSAQGDRFREHDAISVIALDKARREGVANAIEFVNTQGRDDMLANLAVTLAWEGDVAGAERMMAAAGVDARVRSLLWLQAARLQGGVEAY